MLFRCGDLCSQPAAPRPQTGFFTAGTLAGLSMARCLPHPVRHAFGMRALSKQQLVIGSMALPFGYNCQCQQLQLSSSHLSDSCSFFQVSDCVSRRAPQNVGQEPGRAFLGSGFGLANPFHHSPDCITTIAVALESFGLLSVIGRGPSWLMVLCYAAAT